jgi:hypothetical protein
MATYVFWVLLLGSVIAAVANLIVDQRQRTYKDIWMWMARLLLGRVLNRAIQITALYQHPKTAALDFPFLAHFQTVSPQFAVEVGALQADGLGGGADIAAVLFELAL